MRRDLAGEDGVALVAVLWAIMILSLIAAAVVTSTTFSYKVTRNIWSRVEAGAAADAAITRGILAMLDKRPDQRWRVDGTPYDFEFGGWKAQVRIEDEFGKIDINEADAGLLKRLFVANGIAEDTAPALADRILEWRQRDPQQPLVTGSSNNRHGPFQSLDEIKLVAGMTPDLVERLRPAITVYSGRPLVDTSTASNNVLMAYLGIDRDRANEMIAKRLSGAANSDGGLVSGGKIDPAMPIAGRSFSIEAQVERNHSHQAKSATVLITGDPGHPYLVFDWN